MSEEVDLQSMQRQIWELRSLEEIRMVKHKYARCLSQSSDEIEEVFAENARCELGTFGVVEGRAELGRFFRENVYPHFAMAVHMYHNPEISFTGPTTAKGTWHYEVYQRTREPDASVWLTGWFEDEYVLEDDGWKIQSYVGTYFFLTDMNKLWHVERYSPYPPGSSEPLPQEFRQSDSSEAVAGAGESAQ